MKLTKQRKVYGAVVSLALTALGLDRFVFPGGEAPVPAAAAQVAPSQPTKKVTTVAAPAKTQEANLAGLAALAVRMRNVAEVERLDLADAKDSFRAPPAWAGEALKARPAAAAATAAPPVDPAASFHDKHHLVAVLKSTRGGVAILDGKTVRIGKEVDGFRLTAVGDRTAIFMAGTTTITLELPAATQLDKESVTSSAR